MLKTFLPRKTQSSSSTTKLDLYKSHLQEIKRGPSLAFCLPGSQKDLLVKFLSCDHLPFVSVVLLDSDKGAGPVKKPEACVLGFGSCFVKTLFL